MDNGEEYTGDWSFMPEEDMRALEESAKLERDVHGEEASPTRIAQKILDDASVVAAQSIVNIATKDPNSNTRLRASQYIVDRALGKIGAEPTKTNPWDELFQEVATEVRAKREQ